jgi:hypothetical protein
MLQNDTAEVAQERLKNEVIGVLIGMERALILYEKLNVPELVVA